MIDIARLGVYWQAFTTQRWASEYVLLVSAVLAAFLGSYAGSKLLRKVTLARVQWIVALLLFIVAIGLMSGAL